MKYGKFNWKMILTFLFVQFIVCYSKNENESKMVRKQKSVCLSPVLGALISFDMNTTVWWNEIFRWWNEHQTGISVFSGRLIFSTHKAKANLSVSNRVCNSGHGTNWRKIPTLIYFLRKTLDTNSVRNKNMKE